MIINYIAYCFACIYAEGVDLDVKMEHFSQHKTTQILILEIIYTVTLLMINVIGKNCTIIVMNVIYIATRMVCFTSFIDFPNVLLVKILSFMTRLLQSLSNASVLALVKSN